MAQNPSSDQNASVADLEAEIAASRERLARNIDEIVHRAQPKTIVAQQKAQLRSTLKSKYSSLMGTDQTDSYTRTGEIDPKADAKAKAADLKSTVAGKAEELKAQAAAKADELKVQASAKAEELKGQATAKLPSRGDSSSDVPGTRASFKSERDADAGSELLSQARVKSDQARLKIDEMTHTEDGELRTDRVAAGLAGLGAVLVGLGAAKRNRS